MSAVRQALKESFESIAFQSGVLHGELTIEIGNVRRNRNMVKSIEKSRIAEIIHRHTNVSVSVESEENPMPNACVYPPTIDKNHPLINDWIVGWINHRDGIQAIRAAKEPLKGTVDLKHSRVSGYFEKILCPIYVTTGLLLDQTFSDGEISAIILHEVGHIFSYFEYVGYTYRTNRIMACTVRAFFECDTATEREVVLKVYEETAGTTLTDRKALLNAKSPQLVTTVLLKNYVETKRNEVNTPVYDQRSFEMLADEFASRHGAGRDLVTGLNKLFLMSGSTEALPGFWSGLLYVIALIVEAAAFFLMLLGPLGMPLLYLYALPLFFLVMIGSDPNSKIYDDYKDRMDNIRRQLVETLKDKNLPAARKKQALEDLKVVGKIEEEASKHPSFFEIIWLAFGSRRKAKSEVQVQKELEELSANDIYVSANKLIYGV